MELHKSARAGRCVRVVYVGLLVKAFRDLQRVARRFELGHHHSWSMVFKGGVRFGRD